MAEEQKGLPQRHTPYREVQFDGDRLTAVILEGEGVAVPVRTICEVLGLDLDAQSERLRSHEVLARGLRVVNVPVGGRVRSVVALIHRWLPFWLATITPSQVRADVREKLVRYQIEVADVLAALYGNELAAPTTTSDSSLATLHQRLADSLTEVRLAREALLAAQQHMQYLQAAQEQTTDQVTNHEARLESIEGVMDDLQTQIATYTTITAAQQEVIKRSIQRIATRYKQKTGSDIYARLFSTFCIDFKTPKYALLAAGQYSQALTWLQDQATVYLPDDPDALMGFQETLL